jgi:hypothetical protein
MSELEQLFIESTMSSERAEPRPVVVVRLTTSYWHDRNGMHWKQSLRFLKRKCVGYNVIYEDCQNIGANEVIPRIENLSECDDGLYYIVTCNERGSDWEASHIIDEYDYRLVPLK